MKRTFVLLTGLAALAFSFSACHKEPLDNLTNDESRIYITDRDTTVNFSSYQTFAISDSVALVQNGQSTKESDDVDKAFIAAAKKYMQQKGYVLVSSEQNPDLAVNVNRIINTSTGVINYPDYWDYYGGYWDPYSYGYGGYDYYIPYSSYAVYSVNEGALSIDLLDLKNAKATNRIDVIWTGLIRGESILNASTADAQVKTLFDQSTYLQR